MSAVAMTPVDNRPVVKCECGLVQFRTANSQCRRCHAPFESPELEPIPEEKQPVLPLGAMRHDLIGESFSGVLRMVRKAQGITQEELGIRMGVPRNYVNKVENNRALPNLANTLRFCSALGVNPQAFVTAVEIGAQ